MREDTVFMGKKSKSLPLLAGVRCKVDKGHLGTGQASP